MRNSSITIDFMCFQFKLRSPQYTANIRKSRGFTISVEVIFPMKYCTITQIITISLRMKVHKNAIRHL